MKNSLLIHLALIAVSTLFGFSYVIGKYLVSEIPPAAWAFCRALGTGLVLALVMKKDWWRQPRPSHWRGIAVCAVFGVSINQVAFFEGLMRTTPTHTAVITTTVPLFTLFFAILMRNESFSITRLLGMLSGLSGVLSVLEFEKFNLTEMVLGDLLIVVNSISFAFYLAYSRSLNQRINPLFTTCGMFVIGALLICPYGIGPTLTIKWAALSPWVYIAMAYIILGGTIGTYYLNNWALSKTDSSMVALYIYIQPVVAGIASFLIFGEILTERLLLASLLIFIGVLIGNLKVKKNV